MSAAPVTIRPARADDAEAAAMVLRRSITELCAQDHAHDATRLKQWLHNKTPDHFRRWLADPLNSIFVAVKGEKILGVGAVRQGEGITLNYVDHEARFSGVSRAMVAALEAVLRRNGAATAYLVSTRTALAFYAGRGYRERNLPEAERHPFGIAMEKPL